MTKIGVFPASGALGTSLYTHLCKFTDPADVKLISRHPETIPNEYLEAGVTVAKADYNSPESLKHAFDGVTCLVLISYPSREHEHRVEVHKRAIEAARLSSPGVTHVFYTSLAFGGDCRPDSVAYVMQAHLDTEKYLKSLLVAPGNALSGKQPRPFTFTSIREGIYSEAFPIYTAFWDLKNPIPEIRIPHDGSGPGIAWVKRDELGEASARLVQEYAESPTSFRHLNQVMLLSGPRALSLAETVEVLSEVSGRRISLKEVGLAEYVAEPVVREKLRLPGRDDAARDWATVFEAVRRGETAVTSVELERLLRRAPETFEVTVRAMATN